ncbi:MAG: hypothetical protein K1X79_04655 [Oligoflexia bacterium]|nr:hypothetical protein [Oligoflexia bacterium]
MSESNKFLSYGIVILCSAIIVALGAHELERRFAHHGPRREVDMKVLVRELQGDTDEVRASMSGNATAPQKRPKDQLEEEDKVELKSVLDKLLP